MPGAEFGGAGSGGGAGFGGAPAAGGSHTMIVSGGGGYDRAGYDRGGYATGRFDAGGAGYGGEDTYHGHEPFLQRWLFSRRLAYVAAAVVAVIGLGVGGWYVTSGRYTPLPSVDGMTLTAAEQALHQAGFGVRVGTPLIDNNVPKGDVVSTSPSGRAVKGATIVLTVSSGPKMIVIPPVAGKTLGEAISALRAAGLTVSDTPNKVGVDGAAVGSVAGTTPAAGTSWPANRVVYVNQVAGMALPNLVGQDFNTVQNNWANPNHIQLSQMQVASNQPQGIIVRQSPAPNTPVTQGETVTVYVSSGPPQVAIPGDLRGQHFGQVQQELQQLGFQVDGKPFGPGDTVFFVNPSGSAPSGSMITVYYGGI